MSTYFENLVLRTRGRRPMVVSKLETMLAAPRGNQGVLPELASGHHAGEDGAEPARPEVAPPSSEVSAAPSIRVAVAPEFEGAAGRAFQALSGRALLAAARARTSLTLSNYLARRRG